MKKLIFICIIATFLTGCEKRVSQEKYDEVFNNLQTVRMENEELKLKLENIINYDVFITNDFAYQIPTTWTTAQNDENLYYYPENGLLMIQSSVLHDDYLELTSKEIDELLTSYENGITQSSTNYEKASSKLMYVDTNVVAKELVFYCDYENVKYENKAVSFFNNGILNTFVLAQPSQLEDSQIFDNIISSIRFIK